jgi:DNA polymerase-3 subunit beta
MKGNVAMTESTQTQQVTFLQENAARAFKRLAQVVDNKPSMAVLGNVLMESQDERLRLTAVSGDFNFWLTYTIGAKVDAPLRATVPVKFTKQVIENLSRERVELCHDINTVTAALTCGNSSAEIKGIDPEEFPPVPAMRPPQFVMDATTFKRMVLEVAHAFAKEDNRPFLTGINMHLEGQKMTLATADGYRLAMQEAEFGCTFAEPVDVTITGSALVKMVKMLDKDEHDISISATGENVQFQTRNFDATIACVPGRYPDFKAIIPRTYASVAALYRDELVTACKRVAVFAKDNAYSVSLKAKDNRLVLRARSAERGHFESALDCALEGPPVEFSCNVTYLLEAAKTWKEERAILKFNGPANPVVIRPQGHAQNALEVLMPMSVDR